MRLHLADIHLHRARLFFREKPYPWKSPQDDLAAAEQLINDLRLSPAATKNLPMPSASSWGMIPEYRIKLYENQLF